VLHDLIDGGRPQMAFQYRLAKMTGARQQTLQSGLDLVLGRLPPRLHAA